MLTSVTLNLLIGKHLRSICRISKVAEIIRKLSFFKTPSRDFKMTILYTKSVIEITL